MSRKLKFQLILFCFLLLTVLLVQCKDKSDVRARESRSVSASDNLIVSIINNVMKFKDSDFFRTGIESSVRSVFSKPLTSAVYAISVLAGVVAMLAFYESPVSPMPVPPLPDPPVGRFPPEHPIWPPPQRDPNAVSSDKKRVGMVSPYSGGNTYPHIPASQVLFPTNQKYSEVDPSVSSGAYQQIMNLLENRNSKVNVKQNRISSNPVPESQPYSPQVYSSFAVESDPKVLNDSIKLQSLYADLNPNDRHDSIEIINKYYNQNTLNNAFDKLKELNGLKKSSNIEVIREKDKVNYTSIASSTDSNANRRVKTRIGET